MHLNTTINNNAQGELGGVLLSREESVKEVVKCFYFGGGELDRRLGSSLLRHSYLSHKYGEEANEKEKDADLMMHSVAMQDGYIKK